MTRLQKYKTALACAACLAYAVLSLAFPAAGTAALREGLVLCAERLIPSLLPFLFIAGFMLRSGAADAIGWALAPLTRRVLRLPGICAPVILMSLIGGYPVGPGLTAALAQSGRITSDDSRRMTRFCFGAGPAFAVLGIGQGLLGSAQAGWIIYAAQAVSALTIGLIIPKNEAARGRNKDRGNHLNPDTSTLMSDTSCKRYQSIGGALTESVRSAARQMLLICVWTLLFGTLCAYLRLFVHNEYLLQAACALLEVTAGARALASTGSLPLIAAALAWGGLCVHFQIHTSLGHCGRCLWSFILWRLAQAALAALLCRVLLLIFPVVLADPSVSVSAAPAVRMWQLSAPAAVGLAMMGIGLLAGYRSERSYKRQ